MREHVRLLEEGATGRNDGSAAPGDLPMRQQMMEQRMDMMQCSMRLMMDQKPAQGSRALTEPPQA
jgi:hypothetical protein